MHPLVHLIGVQVLDVDLGGGVLALEALDVVAHVAEADGIDGGDLDGGAASGAGAADRRLQFQVLLDQSLAALVVDLAQRRQLQRPLEAVDQLDAQPLFELADDQAGRRLGEVVVGRRLRDAAAAGHVAEDLQRVEAGQSSMTLSRRQGSGTSGESLCASCCMG